MLLTEFRQQYPQYDDLSDAELADGLYRKFYSDIPRFEFDQKIGLGVNAEPAWTGDPNAIAAPPDLTPRFPGGEGLPSIGFEMQQPETMPPVPAPSGLSALSVEPALPLATTGAVPVMPSLTQQFDADEDRWAIGGAGGLDFGMSAIPPIASEGIGPGERLVTGWNPPPVPPQDALAPVRMSPDPYAGTPDWQAYPGLVVRGTAETGLGMGLALESLSQQQTDETRAFYDEYLSIQPGDRDTAEDLIRRVQRSGMTPARKSLLTQAVVETVRNGSKKGSRELGIDVPVDTETGERYGRAREALRQALPASDAQEQSLLGQVMRAGGSSVGFLAFAPIPGGIWAAGALSGAGEAAERAYRTGASAEAQGAATALGTIPGALDALSIDSMIRGVARTPGAAGWLRSIVLTGLRTGAIEGTTEGVQQAMQNVIARIAYDPDAAIAEGVPENALVGFLAGGAMGSVGGAFSRHLPTPVTTPERQEPPPLDVARTLPDGAVELPPIRVTPPTEPPPGAPGVSHGTQPEHPAAIPAGAQPGEAVIGPVEPPAAPPAPPAPPAAPPRVPRIDLPQAAGFPTDQDIGVQAVPESELRPAPPAPATVGPGVRVRIETPRGPAEGVVVEEFQEPRPEQPGAAGARSAPAYAVQLDSGETVDVAPDRARIEVVAPARPSEEPDADSAQPAAGPVRPADVVADPAGGLPEAPAAGRVDGERMAAPVDGDIRGEGDRSAGAAPPSPAGPLAAPGVAPPGAEARTGADQARIERGQPPALAGPLQAARVVAEDTAATPAGTDVPVRYAVVELDSLIPSQTDQGAPNPRFTGEQPRDRSRAASQAQVAEIAARLDPRRLDRNPSTADGAPLVSPDGMVDSGNGRILAIRRAYRQGLPSAYRYRQHLVEQGYPVEGMQRPVLVRINDAAPDMRARIAAESNARSTLAMSATEQAMADARAMRGVLHFYRGGEIGAAGNREFVRHFVDQAVGAADRGSVVDSQGQLSGPGIRRIQAAMLAAAYGDANLVETLIESADNDIRAIGGALVDAAPAWAQMRQEAEAGQIDPAVADVTKDLLEAVRLVQRARSEGQHVADLAAQMDMFGGRTISAQGELFLRLFFRDTRYRSQRGRPRIAQALTYYAAEARKAQPGPGLFGDADKATPAGILENARRQADGPDQQQGDLLQPGRGRGDGAGLPPPGGDAGQRAAIQPADGAGDRGAVAEPARGADAEGRSDPVAPQPRARRRQARSSPVDAFEAYFQPGNIVPSYNGHDRVVAFNRGGPDGGWTVTVRKVERGAAGNWVDAPREQDRTHSTAPTARELRAGPTERTGGSATEPGAAQMALGEQPEAAPPLDAAALKAELRRLAPLASLEVIERFAIAGRGPLNGAYYPAFRGIVVAATAPDPMQTLRHEAIHALRDLHLIRPEEWRRLAGRAEAEWIGRYDIEARYPSLSREGQIEEAVAEAFADHEATPLPAGFKAIWDNVKRFLDRLGAWLRGQGFQTVDDVLGRIERGEVGTRAVPEGQGRGTAAAFQSGGRVPAAVFGPRADIRAMRQRAMEFARANLYGRDFVNRETGATMRVNRRGIEKIFHGGGLAPEKIEAVAAIPEIIRDGRMDMTLPDLDGSDRIDYLIFRSEVEVAGTPYDVRFVARRGDGGTFYYDHELSEMRERPAGSRGGVASKEAVADSPPAERPTDDIAPPDLDAKYQVPRLGEDEASAPIPPAQRSRSVLDAIKAGQPIDRIMRLPFRLLGGVTERGEWKPGVRLADWGAEVINERKLDPNGRLAWLNPAIEKVRAGVIDRYGQDPEYVARDRQRQNEETRRARQGLEIVRGLIHDGMDANEAAILQAVLTGEPIPPGKWEKVAPGIRAAIDEMGADAMALGLISAESYERNRGAYLNRSYLKHEATVEGGGLGRLAQNMGKAQRVKLIGSELKGRGIFLEIDPAELDPRHRVRGTMIRVLDDARPDTTGKVKNWARAFVPAGEATPARFADWTDKGAWEVRQTAPGKLVLWRDYTKAERERMGEILDARYTIAKTFYLMAHDLATGRFYQDIATNEAWATKMQPPEGSWVNAREANIFAQLATDVEWVKVPDTAIEGTAGVKKWGALAGMYVRSEIWRDLNQVAAMANRNAWDYVLSQWKLNKTARSPVTHMNNVMSNVLFMDMNDVRLQDLVEGVRSYMAGDQDFKEAEANGAFGTGFVGAEIKREVLEPILREIEAEATGGKKSTGHVTRWLNQLGGTGKVMAALGRAVKKADEKMLAAYRAEDDVFRMALYKRRRAMGDSVEAAANAAREVFLDYDIRAPWVNAARRTALPFIAYTYRAIPGVARAIATKPWKLAKYALLAQMANIAAYSMWPGDEDEERRNLRKDQRGYTWIGSPRMLRLWVDGDGPNFLDVRRWIPAGDVFDLNQGSSAIPLPSWLQIGGPLQVGMELALNRSNFTGKDIRNAKTDDALDQAGKVAGYIWKSWAPSAVWVPGSWYQTKVIDALSGVRDRTGNELDPLKALISSFGIKVQGMDLNQAKYWRQAAYETIKRDLAFERNRAIDDHARGAMSDSAYRSTMADIAAKEKRAEAEVADILKDAAFQQWLKQFEARRRTVRSNAKRDAKRELAPASP